MNDDQSNTGKLMDDSEQLQMALCTLAHNIGSSDMCILRLILLDIFNIVKKSALEYFTELQNHERITIKDVSIVYEILLLMGKRKLWTAFRKTLVDERGNGHNHVYDVEKNSTHFSEFRRTMIKIGKQFTGKLNSLSMMYGVPDDITNIWMTLIYLEDKRKVDFATKASLLKFQKRLTVADSPQAGRIIQQYVESHFSSQTGPAGEQIHSEPESRKPINAEKGRSFEVSNLAMEVKKKQLRVEAVDKKMSSSAEEFCRIIEETGKQLKNNIDLCVNEQILELKKLKYNKHQNLEQVAIVLKVFSLQIEEMRNALQHQTSSCDSLNLKKVEESLSEVYPEVHGYFKWKNTDISEDLSEFREEVSKYLYYVDYIPVDPDKCSVNFLDLNNSCFDINESITLKVVLKDSQNHDVSEEHEKAPVKLSVQLQDDDKLNDYEVSDVPSKECRTFNISFKNTGLWKLDVFVCGKMVSESINLKILSEEGLKETIDLNTEELGGHIFDVCFTSNGKCLLACNNTEKIFLIAHHKQNLFSSIGDKKKVANLCCIDDGRVFVTETTEREIVELDQTGHVTNQFGKCNFKDGSPQGIAATCKYEVLHVFVSDTQGKCVQHYINQVLFATIKNLPTPDKRTITPWFLDVNKHLHLFICNNKGIVTSLSDQHSNHKNICYVEILDVHSNTLVKSLKCDSAVCIDEQSNVFLGTNIGVKMFDSNLKYIKEVACNGDCSYGLSAFKGCLAVVFPGSIKYYQY